MGEDTVQCYFCKLFFALLACISSPSHLNRRFSYSQSLRFTPIVIALVLSFASDTRYSLSDVLETLPGYLALLLHILSTGASEHLRSILAPSVGARYASVSNTVGAATFGLIVYVAREILVSISWSSSACHWSHVSHPKTSVPSHPAVPLFSLLAIPLAAYSAQCGRNSIEASVSTTPQYNLLSSASALLATISFGFIWFSRLPTTSEILMGALFLYGQLQSCRDGNCYFFLKLGSI